MSRRIHTERLGRRKACDLCCRKKIRCDGKAPKCSACVLHKSECTWTPEAAAPKSSRRLELSNQLRFRDIESRLTEIEARLQGAGTGGQPPGLEWTRSNPLLGPPLPLEPYIPSTDNNGASTPSSRPLGTATSTFDLPPPKQVFALVDTYFRGPNQAVPLFHQPSFLKMLQEWYRHASLQDPASWASINVVLALAARDTRSSANEKLARECMNKAQSVLNILVSREDDFKGIQVLLGLIMLFLGSSYPHPTCVLIATAVKLAHRLRLHAREDRAPKDSELDVQMDRLFWITYVLDREICLRTIEPYALHEDDFDVQTLGSAAPDDGAGILRVNNIDFNYFYLCIRLAQIQSFAYRTTSSVGAGKLSADQRLEAAEHVDDLVHSWQTSLPPELLPEQILSAQIECSDAQTHLIYLHLTAYHVRFVAHRIHARDTDWIHRLTGFSDRYVASANCNAAYITPASSSALTAYSPSFLLLPPNWASFVRIARLCVRLIQKIDYNTPWIFWSTACVYQASLIILIANNLTVEEHDVHDQIDADTQLINHGMQRTQDAMTLHGDSEAMNVLSSIYRACSKLHERALMAVQLHRMGIVFKTTDPPNFDTNNVALSSE